MLAAAGGSGLLQQPDRSRSCRRPSGPTAAGGIVSGCGTCTSPLLPGVTHRLVRAWQHLPVRTADAGLVLRRVAPCAAAVG